MPSFDQLVLHISYHLDRWMILRQFAEDLGTKGFRLDQVDSVALTAAADGLRFFLEEDAFACPGPEQAGDRWFNLACVVPLEPDEGDSRRRVLFETLVGTVRRLEVPFAVEDATGVVDWSWPDPA